MSAKVVFCHRDFRFLVSPSLFFLFFLDALQRRWRRPRVWCLRTSGRVRKRHKIARKQRARGKKDIGATKQKSKVYR